MTIPRPMFSKIVVRRDPSETMNGSLEIPKESQILKCTGTVLAVGEGRLCAGVPPLPCLKQTLKVTDVDHEALSINVEPEGGRFIKVAEFDQYQRHRCHVEPLRVRVMDRIFFSPFACTGFEHDGESLLIMDEDDVLAVLSSEASGAPI